MAIMPSSITLIVLYGTYPLSKAAHLIIPVPMYVIISSMESIPLMGFIVLIIGASWGSSVGDDVGCDVGCPDGIDDGVLEGQIVGNEDGMMVGNEVGDVGCCVGIAEGIEDG